MAYRDFSPQHDTGGDHHEYQHKGHQQTDRHHPAKINHRADIAEHQRGEGDHGGEHGIKAGNHHRLHSLFYQLGLGTVRMLPMQLPITHHQVDGDGHGNNQQH